MSPTKNVRQMNRNTMVQFMNLSLEQQFVNKHDYFCYVKNLEPYQARRNQSGADHHPVKNIFYTNAVFHEIK